MSSFRMGRHYPIHVYEGDIPVCTALTVDYARRIVTALNYMEEYPPGPRVLASLAAPSAVPPTTPSDEEQP